MSHIKHRIDSSGCILPSGFTLEEAPGESGSDASREKMMARRVLMILGLLAWLAASWTMSNAAAEELNAQDAQAIRTAIQAQLDAFAEDDADRAFGLASATARSQIGSADNFLRMIKREYAPVYRHRMVIFATPEMVDDRALQLVRLTDSDSLVWIAVYVMQRESDGSWKIDGCRLLETTSVAI